MQQVQLFATSSAHLCTEVALSQQFSPGDCILHLLCLCHCNGSEYQMLMVQVGWLVLSERVSHTVSSPCPVETDVLWTMVYM